ncbi:DUF6713 family protein [Pontivivens ytuae]|uniref:Uncharacterized protein n=1 Tax=Pontivivens ytuae TaxID=2789856 RepID=A0A7S9QCR0_9RHOB|nr:DUF6713 family protein [Pontivivens ytuae]QPH53361.1 hypothetical protein I0K15_16450 [Pontivivens ytuae]
MADLAFALMAGFFFTHELDAMRRHEWRILPLLRDLPEARGEAVFVWLHVPLFAALLWLALQGAATVGAAALSTFAVIHVGLHWLFRTHPANEFDNLTSWILIGGAGLFGLVHLALLL